MDDEDHTSDDAALEVTADFHFSDRQAIIFDDAGRVVAASIPPADTRGQHAWPAPEVLAQSLGGVMETTKRAGRTYATVRGQGEDIRAFASSVKGRGKAYTVVILQSLHDQYEVLEQARRALALAVPLALALASLGGYFLA